MFETTFGVCLPFKSYWDSDVRLTSVPTEYFSDFIKMVNQIKALTNFADHSCRDDGDIIFEGFSECVQMNYLKVIYLL